jgi:hypothetical protein
MDLKFFARDLLDRLVAGDTLRKSKEGEAIQIITDFFDDTFESDDDLYVDEVESDLEWDSDEEELL